MRDASYLRAQAGFCLDLARQMSDPKAAADLKMEAARHHAEAASLEADQGSDDLLTTKAAPK